jgi:hypothetical protein
MNKFITVTIDVEPDCTLSWRYADPLTFRGVEQGVAERLHPLFLKHNIVPTYLINNVVLEDDNSVNVFKSLKGPLELGTHLHPEFIEPHKQHHHYAGKKGVANCCFYPPAVEFEKIAAITNLFRNKFGYSPLSFRAGRFSAGANTISSLQQLGYKVDTSVTPHVVWDDRTREQPVDFRKAPEQPYFIKPGTILERDPQGAILQVPVTVTEAPAVWWKELKRTRFGTRGTIRRRRPLWLRPVYASLQECVRIAEEYFARYQHEEVVVLNMMFHNVEVMPGLSPYTRSEKDCQQYLGLLEDFFSYCRQHQVKGIKLSDVYELYR